MIVNLKEIAMMSTEMLMDFMTKQGKPRGVTTMEGWNHLIVERLGGAEAMIPCLIQICPIEE